MTSAKQWVFSFVVAAITSAVCGGCEIVPTNPFDPKSKVLEPGSIAGTIQAIFARDETGQPAVAGSCAAREGDHSGFDVTLRGVRDDGEGIVGSAITNASGAFRFDRAPPGDYTLEIERDGFDTPPPLSITIGIGEPVFLLPICALNLVGPARPLLAALPPAVSTSASPPVIEVIDIDAACVPSDPGCTVAYRIAQAIDGVDEVVVSDDLAPADARTALVLGAGPATRRAVRVAVTAVDSLGNSSEAATATVVVDGIAPPPPVDVFTVASRDRLSLRWKAGDVAAADDAPAFYVVSYGLVPRSTSAGCPFGAPVFVDGAIVDVESRSSFAVEGTSPLVTASTTQQLSGIAAGTEVVVHVAAVDSAGNAGCYTSPVKGRPDDVTFVLTDTLVGVVAPAQAVVRSFGSPRSGVLVAARGSGGLTIGANSDATPANDVVVDGRTVYSAAGALGVRRVDLDKDGAPIAASVRLISTGSDVTALAVRPGQLAWGSTTAQGFIDLQDESVTVQANGSAPVRAVRAAGRNVVYVRDVGASQARVEVFDIDNFDLKATSPTFNTQPDDVLVVGEELWLALGDEGLVVLDLRCGAGDSGCLSVKARRALPGGAVPTRFAVYDDRVLVAATDAFDVAQVFAIDHDAALSVRGRAVVGDGSPSGVIVDDGGACVAIAAADGDRVQCVDSVASFFIDQERRFTSGLTVLHVRAGSGFLFALEDSDGLRPSSVAVLRFSDLGLHRRVVLPPVGGNALLLTAEAVSVLDDGTALVLDNLGRILSVDPSKDEATVVSSFNAVALLPSLGDVDDPGHGGFTGVLERRGQELYVGLASATGAGLLRFRLSGSGGVIGASDPGSDDVVDCGAVDNFTRLLLDSGRALVTTQPFGLFVVDIDGPELIIDNGASIAVDTADNTFASDVGVARLGGVARVIVPGIRSVAGGGVGAGVFVVNADGAVSNLGVNDNLAASIRAMTTLRNLLVLSTVADGIIVVDDVVGAGTDVIPVLAIPSASQAKEPAATARGVLAADGGGGVVFAILR